jgi:hypothetical protein
MVAAPALKGVLAEAEMAAAPGNAPAVPAVSALKPVRKQPEGLFRHWGAEVAAAVYAVVPAKLNTAPVEESSSILPPT